MLRPTKAELEAEIIDCAAGIFARHGFERASVQQIADALNYSKTGLLHHYASKKALYEAVHTKYESLLYEMLDHLLTVPEGIERDRVMIEDSINFAFDWPGISAFGRNMIIDSPVSDSRFEELGQKMFKVMGIDFTVPNPERLTRVLLTLNGMNFFSQWELNPDQREHLRTHLVKAAMDALGHHSH